MNNLTTPYRSVVAWFTQRKLLNMQNKEVVVAFVDFTLPLLSLSISKTTIAHQNPRDSMQQLLTPT